jgi:hypothetical protein
MKLSDFLTVGGNSYGVSVASYKHSMFLGYSDIYIYIYHCNTHGGPWGCGTSSHFPNNRLLMAVRLSASPVKYAFLFGGWLEYLHCIATSPRKGRKGRPVPGE